MSERSNQFDQRVSHGLARTARRTWLALGLIAGSLAVPAQATEIVIRFAGESSDFDPIPIGEIVILNNQLGLEVPADACGVRLSKPGQLWDEPWGFHAESAGIGSYMHGLFGNGDSAEYLQVHGPIGACDGGVYTFQTPATADSPTFFPPGSGSIVMQVSSATEVEWVLDGGEYEPAEVPEFEEPMSILEVCEATPEFCDYEESDFTVCPNIGDSNLHCESDDDDTGMLINHFTSAGARTRVAGALIESARRSVGAGQFAGAAELLQRASFELGRAASGMADASRHEARLLTRLPSLRDSPATVKRLGGLQASRAGIEQGLAECRRKVDAMRSSVRTQTAAAFHAAQRDCAVAAGDADTVVDHVRMLRAANLPRLLPR